MEKPQSIEKMQLDIIRKYGLESEQAIEFCTLCELGVNRSWLDRFYQDHMYGGDISQY